MDTSADDPHTFRLRRSPSIGSASASMAPTARSGKRKLSTAAFGSSPNLGPHAPSSPTSVENAADDSELKSSQVSSSSRTPLVASTTRPIPVSASADTDCDILPQHDLSERRCHGHRSEFDYSVLQEDRRDPRIASTCVVMAVPANASAASRLSAIQRGKQWHPDAPNDLAEPIGATVMSHEETRSKKHPCMSSNGKRHGAELNPSLSQQSSTGQLTPERRLSPSPSFGSCFFFQTPSPQIDHSQLTSSLLSTRSADDRMSSTDFASEKQYSPSQRPYTSSRLASPLHSNHHPPQQQAGWLRSASMQSHPTSHSCQQRSETSSPGPKSRIDDATARQEGQISVQLAPAPKRRKLESHQTDRSAAVVDPATTATHHMTCHPQCKITGSAPSAGEDTTPIASCRPQVVSKIFAHASASYSKKPLTAKTRPVESALPSLPAAPTTRVPPLPVADAALLSASQHKATGRLSRSHRRRAPRLMRANSMPNLRAKPTLDVAKPSQHHLVIPQHWISSHHDRSSRHSSGRAPNHGGTCLDHAAAVSRSSGHRSSRGQPFSLTQYSMTSSSGSRSRVAFAPSLHPPITRHTLRELDLFEILKNPQLRHDVVFDPNVQFRPNFDGERGRRKREAGERYWTAVAREIESGCTCTAFDEGRVLPCTCSCATSAGTGSSDRTARNSSRLPVSRSQMPSRIPLLVQELRAICLSILPCNFPPETTVRADSPSAEASGVEGSEREANAPASKTEAVAESSEGPVNLTASSGPAWAATHHQLIAQTLDPHLIAQELQHGVLDVQALVTFLGSILKLHCAPMRDDAIEKMVEIVCVDRNVGKGLRLCFEILELMKLDIANHQLRSTRPYLVETAVEFEMRWFKDQIEQGKMTLDRTHRWFLRSLADVKQSVPGLSRSETISRAFHDGLLQLILEVPGTISFAASSPASSSSPSSVSGTPTTSAPAGPTSGVSPSSSSLNNTFATFYPETFQFDAYRMMTFHNDVADLTIVYMLLLLFRQLCCSPLEDGQSVPASAGNLAQKQIKSVKGEIWCLLNDANLCLSGSSVEPLSPNTAARRGAPPLEARVSLGSAGGFVKLSHPRWRRAMQNVLLQIAVRASAVQIAARQGLADPSLVKPEPPSAKTQRLLDAWMNNNLRVGSTLHKLCQKRLRELVLALLADKTQAESASGAVTSDTMSSPQAPDQKHDSAFLGVAAPRDDVGVDAVANKHASPTDDSRSHESSLSPTARARRAALSSQLPWETALCRAGLDPFAAEIRLLSDRIAKVAIFHLRVFRNLYEKMDVDSPSSSDGSL
ncbi:hypothetical protein BCV70DRAFT_225303 [Testicularia cyperi]|uniref:Tcp11-domain-containing protein n=1 Tax=Testicularia cyperi TaxID=1882483 RepID=A0A317XUM0_9BASI|nr:hypothetical protein BCV70DRAFT_225303 [Testicularia cyperi]